MSTRITQAPFGRLPDGDTVTQFTLVNANGLAATIIDLDGVITGLHVPDREGRLANVVLGADTLDAYLGATHLHGGERGLHRWRARVQGNILRLAMDGATVSYALTDDNELVMRFDSAAGSAPRHCYFNLAGLDDPESDILGHVLSVDADAFVPIDAATMPLGVLSPVTGTPFDFRMPRPIGERIAQPDKQLRHGQGYDHAFVLNRGREAASRRAAHVVEPGTGRVLELFTDEPGLQFDSGNRLDGALRANGRQHAHRSGLCLAPRQFPGSPRTSGQSESRWRFSVAT